MASLATIDDLRAIQYLQQDTFSIVIEEDDTFTSEHITRCLPGKRISCKGSWQGKSIFAKFFISASRVQKHWQSELDGIALLSKAKIRTPQLLHSGHTADKKIYYIFFEYLENSQSLQLLWESSSSSERVILLDRLMVTFAEHHMKGILQNDLHLNNFLLANDQLFTLDGADINAFNSSDKMIACNNLARLFGQFYPTIENQIPQALSTYFQNRHWPENKDLVKMVEKETLQQREVRKLDFMAKTKRKCSLFNVEKTWTRLCIYARKYQSDDFFQMIGGLDALISSGKILKNGLSSTVSIASVGDKQWVIKRYNIKNWRHFISRAPRPSRASISWHNTNLLKFYGIATPEPIAMVEKRFGPIRKNAYFISELAAGKTYWDFLYHTNPTDNEKEMVAQSVCNLLQSLKKQMISHGDLKISNIMISNGSASLIDLDGTRQHSNQKSFAPAHQKDIKRFFKNWEDDTVNGEYYDKRSFNF